MPQQLTQGHTYAIGLSQRANLAEAANTARAQGWSLPPAYLAGALFYGGWSPVVYYPAQTSPIAPPPDVAWLTQWIAIAYRSGQSATVQGYAGEVSALTPFGPELTFVQDLNAPPSYTRALAADPAPGSFGFLDFNGLGTGSGGTSSWPGGTVPFQPAPQPAPWPETQPEPEPETSAAGKLAAVAGVALVGVAVYYATRSPKRVRRNPPKRYFVVHPQGWERSFDTKTEAASAAISWRGSAHGPRGWFVSRGELLCE